MKKLLLILTVTAFAVVANAGDACCAKKEAVSATTCSSDKAAACSAKGTCSASATTCNKNGAQKVAVKQLKSPRHASQS